MNLSGRYLVAGLQQRLSSMTRIYRVCLAVALIASGLLADQFHPENRGQSFSAKSPYLNLELPSSKPIVYPTGGQIPLAFDTTLSVMAKSDEYTNIFSTSDGPNAIRLELTKPNTLNLALGTRYMAVATNFNVGTVHTIAMTGRNGSFLKLYIDGHESYDAGAELLDFQKYDFDTFVLGSGFERKRQFLGHIVDFSLSAVIARGWSLQSMLRSVFALLVTVGALSLLRLGSPAVMTVAPRATIAPLVSDYVALAMILALGSTGFVIYRSPLFGGSWGLLIALGLSVPGIFLWKLVSPPMALWRVIERVSVGFAAILSGFLSTTALADAAAAVFLLSVVLLAVIVSVVTRPRTFFLGDAHASMPWNRLLAFVVFTFLAAASLRELPNWIALKARWLQMPFITLAGLSLSFAIVSVALSKLNQIGPAKTAVRPRLVWLFSGLCLLLLAFRSDSLFIEGSQFHWAYFVGPVQAVRDGGWLLWDVPSQYGFLSILMASIVPVASAWDAFYLFQALVLLIASGIFYLTIVRCRVPNVAALLIVAATFFLADPRGSIGPSPFPSSSGVRFIWCYVLLGLAAHTFLGPAPTMRTYLSRCVVPWILGVFWSAESLVYSTAITFAPVACGVLQKIVDRRRSPLLRELLVACRPVGCLMAALSGMFILFAVRIGHAPDLSMFFQYAVGYAGGFGALPLTYNGPAWVFLLLLACGLSAGFSLARSGQRVEGPLGLVVAAMACIWVVMSYYIGRAAPDNVSALLPLLVFTAILIVRASNIRNEVDIMHLAVVSTLVGFVVTSSVWSPSFAVILPKLASMPRSIVSKLHLASPELAGFLKDASLSVDKPVSYYGHIAAMPGIATGASVTSYERPFFFGPAQLLETPISASRREMIIERFARRHQSTGFLLRKRGEGDDRAKDLIAQLDRWYRSTTIAEGAGHQIIRFEPR